MNVNLLIDAVMRQTMVLIAQLATNAGLRAPLAHLANQVFIELAGELESQGLSNKVIADMFGLALRSYQLKIQRLSESSTEPDRTLWEAILTFIQANGTVPRSQILDRFRNDPEASVRSILKDQVESGFLFKTGRGWSTAYRAAFDDEGQVAQDSARASSTQAIVWVAIYRNSPITREGLGELLRTEDAALDVALAQLHADGRVTLEEGDDGVARYDCRECIIPVGTPVGWEAALFDHYQAMVMSICSKLRGGQTRSLPSDTIGGSTYSFDVWPGHPEEDKVLGLLRFVRAYASDLMVDVKAFNDDNPAPDDGSRKIVFYVGQTMLSDREEDEES